MKVEELVKQCIDSINNPLRSPESYGPLITLVGKHTLFPRGGGPRPVELLCVNSNGDKVWLYSATKVLAALVANGLVEIKEGI
jgi:hypothetical protein